MAGEWSWVPLSELTEADTPITYGVVKPGPEDADGVLFIRGGDIANGRVLVEQLRTITQEVSCQYRRTLLHGGEIVVSLVGNPGQVAIVPGVLRGANIARQVGLVRLRQGLDSAFIKYFLSSPAGQELLGAHSLGSVQQVINLRDLKTVRVPIPPLAEQRAIAQILGHLDDKIELNRRMNATLEAMALAIFEQAQQAENWVEIPLGSVADIYDGPHATPKLTETGPIFLGIGNLASSQLDLSDTKHLGDEDFVRWTRRITPSAGDVVFSYETRLGQAALIPAGLQCCLGRRMGLLRAKRSDISPVLLLRAYLADPFQETIRARTIHGSTVDRIPLKDMHSFPVRLPQGPSAESLSAQLIPLQAKLEANQRENQTLATLRDTLLPKLLSGEIRLQETAEPLEQVIP